MDQEEMEILLAELSAIFAPSHAKNAVKKVTRRLCTDRVEEYIPLEDLTYETMRKAFAICGTVLFEKENTVTGIIPSGALDLNLSVAAASLEDSQIHITACAKEGLIKQHAAGRAIQKFKTTLLARNISDRKEAEE